MALPGMGESGQGRWEPSMTRLQVAAGQGDFLQARFALLHLLAALLAGRPELQRSAVRNWDTVAAVFGLLRDAAMRGAALDVVSLLFDRKAPLLGFGTGGSALPFFCSSL